MSNISPTGFWDGQEPFHAISKPLSDWIVQYLQPHSDKHIYDFGCGRGMYLAKLKEHGFTNLCGFEGSPPSNKLFDNIIKQDLAVSFSVQTPGIVISLEVAEHIPKQFTDIYLSNIYNACANDEVFISSWAVRGQGGHGHCNELNNDEAISLIEKKGFTYLEKESMEARQNILEYQDIPNGHLPWFKGTTLVFRK